MSEEVESECPNNGDNCYITTFDTHVTRSEIFQASVAQEAVDNMEGWGDALTAVKAGLENTRWDAAPEHVCGPCPSNPRSTSPRSRSPIRGSPGNDSHSDMREQSDRDRL